MSGSTLRSAGVVLLTDVIARDRVRADASFTRATPLWSAVLFRFLHGTRYRRVFHPER